MSEQVRCPMCRWSMDAHHPDCFAYPVMRELSDQIRKLLVKTLGIEDDGENVRVSGFAAGGPMTPAASVGGISTFSAGGPIKFGDPVRRIVQDGTGREFVVPVRQP